MRSFLIGLVLLITQNALADHIQLPGDRPIAVTVGTGTFLGNDGTTTFERVQPLYLHGELGLFDLHQTKLNRLNIYGGVSLDLTNMNFRSVNFTPAIHAVLSGEYNWSWVLGARLSLYDTQHFHLDSFVETGGTFNDAKDAVDTFTASTDDYYISLEHLVAKHAKLKTGWGTAHAGLTFAFPLRHVVRYTPFISVGAIWFDSHTDIALDSSLIDIILALSPKSEIPYKVTDTFNSPTVTVGTRLDLDSRNSLEVNGTYFYSGGTMAYWITGSYTFRLGNN